MYIEEEIRNYEDELRGRLIDIYSKGDADTKEVIGLLIRTEYQLAIAKDNYGRAKGLKDTHLKEYEENNKELISKCWGGE